MITYLHGRVYKAARQLKATSLLEALKAEKSPNKDREGTMRYHTLKPDHSTRKG